MYTNIPTSDLIAIIDTACRNNHIEENMAQEILRRAITKVLKILK